MLQFKETACVTLKINEGRKNRIRKIGQSKNQIIKRRKIDIE